MLDAKALIRAGYAAYLVVADTPVPMVEIYGASSDRRIFGLTQIPSKFFLGVYDFATCDMLVHYSKAGPEAWYGENYELLPIACNRAIDLLRFDPDTTETVDRYWQRYALEQCYRMRGDSTFMSTHKVQDQDFTYEEFL